MPDPIDNYQPSTVLKYVIALEGLFPSRSLDDGATAQPLSTSPFLGEVDLFGGNFAPRGYAFAEGQLLQISEYSALFSVLGTMYGGDGRTTFALPDLRDAAAIHAGSGPGLDPTALGEETGTSEVVLSQANMPASYGGTGASFSTEQPSTAINYFIALTGIFPSRSLEEDGVSAQPASGSDQFIGEIGMFAGNFAPRGFALADGQLLPIAQNTALFSILGTTYGGDGRSTFGLPDLRGRVVVGAGDGPGLSNYRLGERGGQEDVTLTTANLPPVPGGGSGTSVNNVQPYIALNYIVATTGVFPSRPLSEDGEIGSIAPEPLSGADPLLGSVALFAGNFAPRGYELANGQLLDIASNQALFSLYGTIYGGDGRTTFGLPDLRGRVPLHDGPLLAQGAKFGTETIALSVADLPNTPPQLDLDADGAGTGFTTTFIEDNGGVAISDSDTTIIDLQNDNIASATITLTNEVDVGQESLAVEGELPTGITIDPASTTTTIILTGSASLAAYEAAIEQIRYNHASETPTVAPARTVTVSVSDGLLNSTIATSTINVVAVDDPVNLLRETGGVSQLITGASTIQAAEDIAVAGDTISVAATEYNAVITTPETVAVDVESLTVNVPVLNAGLSPAFTLDDSVTQFALEGSGGATVTTGINSTEVVGNDGDNSITGGAGNDVFFGGDGMDTLMGGGGADSMAGGAGDDLYSVDDRGDTVSENAGEGTDTVSTTLASYILDQNVENLQFADDASHVGKGNLLANEITGGNGTDQFVYDFDYRNGDTYNGGGGSDSFDARSSTSGMALRLDTGNHGGILKQDVFNDIERFFGSSTANDTMIAGSQAVRFSGFGGEDRLVGGSASDFLQGGAGNDTLYGFADNDKIDGGTGNDMMYGGSGSDQFLFVSNVFGQDQIIGFEDGQDLLQIFSAVGTQVSDFIITGNGTSNVTLTLASDANQSIELDGLGGSNITIEESDFIFY
ncbi:tail fiber protein [Pseudahrensia aquimaris]|uniref:Tail fiber protein n=1 Tax=Pseudahrensia aquimaris TaxID=744461 RepID=A0ABW3FGX9_9HYPH